jgi:outer membrane protein assembly factor BamE (lipoprotein component of BamABCDE complex)
MKRKAVILMVLMMVMWALSSCSKNCGPPAANAMSGKWIEQQKAYGIYKN